MKILLVLLSEAAAIWLTNWASQYITIQHTTLSYIVCGAFLAVVVINAYNYIVGARIRRAKKKAEEELKEITDAALMRYRLHDENDKQR